MRRYHLFEFHELAQFPTLWRNLVTDFLSFFAYFFRPYSVVSKRLAQAVELAGASKIVDLCSGAARPILTVRDELQKRQQNIPIIVSDKFPNVEPFKKIENQYKGEVTPVYSSVDATDVPDEIDGFRTIFTAFHHFDQEDARKIIRDAIEKKQGIGIFEYTERSLAWGFYALNIPWVVCLCSPFMKPFSWQRLVFTYLIPIIPLCVCLDGAVSCMRTYTPAELQVLVQDVEAEIGPSGYTWQIGQLRTMFIMRITYLLGYPNT